jgi:hypothetical protein
MTKYIDTKMVVSVALGIMLAGLGMMVLGGAARMLGLSHGGWDKRGMDKKMMDMSKDMDMDGMMHTMPAGTPLPEGVDGAAY